MSSHALQIHQYVHPQKNAMRTNLSHSSLNLFHKLFPVKGHTKRCPIFRTTYLSAAICGERLIANLAQRFAVASGLTADLVSSDSKVSVKAQLQSSRRSLSYRFCTSEPLVSVFAFLQSKSILSTSDTKSHCRLSHKVSVKWS